MSQRQLLLHDRHLELPDKPSRTKHAPNHTTCRRSFESRPGPFRMHLVPKCRIMPHNSRYMLLGGPTKFLLAALGCLRLNVFEPMGAPRLQPIDYDLTHDDLILYDDS